MIKLCGFLVDIYPEAGAFVARVRNNANTSDVLILRARTHAKVTALLLRTLSDLIDADLIHYEQGLLKVEGETPALPFSRQP